MKIFCCEYGIFVKAIELIKEFLPCLLKNIQICCQRKQMTAELLENFFEETHNFEKKNRCV